MAKSCGVLIFKKDRDNKLKILLCHVTPNPNNGWVSKKWDIPKGGFDLNRGDTTPLDAAIREAYEECNLDLSPEHIKSKMVDLGAFKYNSVKHLHLFVLMDDFGLLDNLSQLKCHSTFVASNNKVYAEVNKYKLFDWNDVQSQKAIYEQAKKEGRSMHNVKEAFLQKSMSYLLNKINENDFFNLFLKDKSSY